MLLLQTDIPKEKLYNLNPVLVDGSKKIITDTIYGTGLATYDVCKFLSYEDFTAERTKKIKLHYWYAHDTVYHFAKGYYMVKANYCDYSKMPIFLRFNDPYDSSAKYHYQEIPKGSLIHLHDHNMNINRRNSDSIRAVVKNSIVVMPCEKWGWRREDCRGSQ